jgi:hypothetical protein
MEVSTFINVKREEHVTSLDNVNPCDQFVMMVTKWKKISMMVMNANLSLHMKNDSAYKNKWGSILKEFKKSFDHMSGIRQNEGYWAMSLQDKISHHLPWLFRNIHYDFMLKFMGKRPLFNFLHTQDLM